MQTEFSQQVRGLAAREKLPQNRVVVPDHLEGLDPLIERTLISLRAAKPDDDGFVKPRRLRCLVVSVSAPSVDRAGRILNALLGALRERGLPLHVGQDYDRNIMAVTVFDEVIQFELLELTERRERPPTESEKSWLRWGGAKKFYHRVPSGRLCLSVITSPSATRKSTFSDTPMRSLEGNLNRFLANLYRVAEDMKICRLELAEARLRAVEEQARAVEAEARANEAERVRVARLHEILEEEQRVAALLREVEDWQRSVQIRRFIEAKSRVLPEDERQAWIDWATVHADRIDPLTKSPHSIIDDKPKWLPPSASDQRHR